MTKTQKFKVPKNRKGSSLGWLERNPKRRFYANHIGRNCGRPHLGFVFPAMGLLCDIIGTSTNGREERRRSRSFQKDGERQFVFGLLFCWSFPAHFTFSSLGDKVIVTSQTCILHKNILLKCLNKNPAFRSCHSLMAWIRGLEVYGLIINLKLCAGPKVYVVHRDQITFKNFLATSA